MKVLTLNIWGGKIQKDLISFLKLQAKETDLFCFQEVYNGKESLYGEEGIVTTIYDEICEALPGFTGFYAESIAAEEAGTLVPYGLAMFVKKEILVIKQGIFELFLPTDGRRLELKEGLRLYNRLLQFVTIPLGGKDVTIFNLHGMYTGGGKNDNPPRLEQSEKIRTILQSFTGEKILCGDFNLNPDTQSIAILEEGMRNLIKDYGITSTRSHYYPKDLKFADYILVTPTINVTEFKVLDDVVSDHLPVMVEIAVPNVSFSDGV